MLQFINKLSEYENETITNTNKKKATISGLQNKVNDKQGEIDIKQCEYTNEPTDELFQELLLLKRELEALKINVKSANEIIQIPPTKIIDPGEVAEEIETFIKKLNLEKYKNNIGIANKKFIDSIDIFDNKIAELVDLKRDISEANVSGYIKTIVLKTLEKYSAIYSYNDEVKINMEDINYKRANISRTAAGLYINKF